jgi:predicted small integral membrane protein
MGITDAVRRGDATGERSWGVWVVALVFGVLVGYIGAWAMQNFGVSTGAFLVVGGVAVWYLSRQLIPSAAIAKGLYLSGFLLMLGPALIYIPKISNESASVGTYIGSILGVLIWGIVFGIVGAGIAGIGYLVDRRAQRKLDSRE